MNKYNESIDLLALYLWPRNTIAWIAFSLAMSMSCILFEDVFRYISGYAKINDWKRYSAQIEDIDYKGALVGVRYSYLVNGVRFNGRNIGVESKEYMDIPSRKMQKIKNNLKFSNQIEIRVDPKNHQLSTYIISPNEIYIIPLVIFFPLSLQFLYILIFYEKLKRYKF